MVKLNELYVFESFDELNMREIPWAFDEDAWWKDNMTFFHGTHVKNLDQIAKNGLRAGPGSKGHGVYLALDPFTARGYASMSGEGGEFNFKKVEKRPKYVPLEKRAVLVVVIPQSDVEKLKTSTKDVRLHDVDAWKKNGKGNPRYWELAEVVYPSDIPANYIKGFMIKA